MAIVRNEEALGAVINLKQGQSFKIKDYRGFEKAIIDEHGNLTIKGNMIKK